MIYSFLVFYCYQTVSWHQLLFFSGLAIAELYLFLGPPEPLPTPEQTLVDCSMPVVARTRWTLARDTFFWCMFVVSLYFLSQPIKDGISTPGWIFLESLSPPTWYRLQNGWGMFYYSLGAILALLSISRLRPLHNFMDRPFSQYLAKYSFSLYLCHGPIQQSLGYRLHTYVFSLFGICEPVYGQFYAEAIPLVWRYNGAFAIAFVPTIIVILYITELFERAFEAPIVQITRKFSKCVLNANAE
jgi:peptidoglycan/LPS O-acetylase OafA/YrhL